jgi:hypothetical protein
VIVHLFLFHLFLSTHPFMSANTTTLFKPVPRPPHVLDSSTLHASDTQGTIDSSVFPQTKSLKVKGSFAAGAPALAPLQPAPQPAQQPQRQHEPSQRLNNPSPLTVPADASTLDARRAGAAPKLSVSRSPVPTQFEPYYALDLAGQPIIPVDEVPVYERGPAASLPGKSHLTKNPSKKTVAAPDAYMGMSDATVMVQSVPTIAVQTLKTKAKRSTQDTISPKGLGPTAVDPGDHEVDEVPPSEPMPLLAVQTMRTKAKRPPPDPLATMVQSSASLFRDPGGTDDDPVDHGSPPVATATVFTATNQRNPVILAPNVVLRPSLPLYVEDSPLHVLHAPKAVPIPPKPSKGVMRPMAASAPPLIPSFTTPVPSVYTLPSFAPVPVIRTSGISGAPVTMATLASSTSINGAPVSIASLAAARCLAHTLSSGFEKTKPSSARSSAHRSDSMWHVPSAPDLPSVHPPPLILSVRPLSGEVHKSTRRVPLDPLMDEAKRLQATLAAQRANVKETLSFVSEARMAAGRGTQPPRR